MSNRRLFPAPRVRICPGMRIHSLLPCHVLLALLLAVPALAQPKPAPRADAAPKEIGKFDDWRAATHVEAGQTVCYALTRAKSSAPALAGRGEVILTVTQRQAQRDAVAISAGFGYAANAAVVVEAGPVSLDFYTAQRSAFARNGAAAVAAFARGSHTVARSPGPPGPKQAIPLVDTFSLKGFGAAYAAINKACPPK